MRSLDLNYFSELGCCVEPKDKLCVVCVCRAYIPSTKEGLFNRNIKSELLNPFIKSLPFQFGSWTALLDLVVRDLSSLFRFSKTFYKVILDIFVIEKRK